MNLDSAKSVTATFDLLPPKVSVSDATLAFTEQAVGTTSAGRTLTIANSGGGTLTIGAITSSDPQFVVNHDCSSLAAGMACSATVAFQPTALGLRGGVLAISTSAGTADGPGLAYWRAELAAVNSRMAVLASFLFSAEFSTQMTTLFGAPPIRPEVNMAMDLFRGALGRLPDSAGLGFWLGEIRKAQCAGAQTVSAKVKEVASLFFGSAEYLQKGRSDRDFVADVYNAYMRRGPGGDSAGFNYWVAQVPSRQRDGVRDQFVPSAEFQTRVAAVVAAGCIAP